ELPVRGRAVPGSRDLLLLAALPVDADQAHAVGVEERIHLLAVDEVLAVRRVARTQIVRGILGRDVPGRSARRRHGEHAPAQELMRRLARARRERDLRAIRRDVVLATAVHEVEPARRIRREILHLARLDVDHENVRRLARGEPAIPEAEHPALGDGRLHRILVWLLYLLALAFRRGLA